MLLYAIEISTHNLLVSQGEYSKASWQWQHQCQDLEKSTNKYIIYNWANLLSPITKLQVRPCLRVKRFESSLFRGLVDCALNLSPNLHTIPLLLLNRAVIYVTKPHLCLCVHGTCVVSLTNSLFNSVESIQISLQRICESRCNTTVWKQQRGMS